MKQDDLFWLWLSLKLGANNPVYLELFRTIGKPYDIYRADSEIIDRVPGMTEETKAALADKKLSDAQNTMTWCRENRVELCRYGEESYPARLMTLKRPPMILYVQGNIPDLTKKLCVCVVGTRNCTEYGAHTAYKISYELATAGAVIISGMAKGIDGVSAAATLAAGGYTIAVLGCGLGVTYPRVHGELMRQIIKHGAVVTEYAPFERPEGRHFPIRNRIISGLSDGALIVEAPADSGAMITAEIANDQGRVIYATPGNVDSEKSEGPNRLIRDGARIVLEGTDVLTPFLSKYQEFLRPEKIRKIGNRSEYQPSVFRKYRMPDYAELARGRESFVSSAEPEESAGLTEVFSVQVPVPVIQTAKPAAAVPVAVSTKPKRKTAKQKTVTSDFVEGSGTGRVIRKADHSAEILTVLPEKYRIIFADLPLDRAFTPDEIVKMGHPAGEIIPALTILEVKGLVRSLPGGMYQRK